ncbi:MAG TPA: 4-phosphoerythronate dehydrogenase [Cellvibrionaceae bacterium]
MLRIVADENIPFLNEFFGHFGEITSLPGRAMRTQDLKAADVLLVRSVTRVNQQLLQSSQVKFVGTCTIGVDHLDADYLNEQKIVTASAPGCNAGGVVQYVLSALARVKPQWINAKIGIVGCGNVGGRLYRVLSAAGVNVCAFDPFKHNSDIRWVQWDELLSCDIICVHTPLTRASTAPTLHLFNEVALAQLKPGTLLLNAGRGEVIDNVALLNRLQQKQDLMVVLDVWEGEPDILAPLMEQVALGTPHIAGYSYEGRVNGSLMIHRALGEFLKVDKTKLDEHEAQVMAEALGGTECLNFTDLNDSLVSIYDVARDDAQLRALVTKEGTSRLGFDLLRKNYPKRRELSHYVISPQTPFVESLRALGFSV